MSARPIELFADTDNSLLKRMLSNANHTLLRMLPTSTITIIKLHSQEASTQSSTRPRKGKFTSAVERYHPSPVHWSLLIN